MSSSVKHNPRSSAVLATLLLLVAGPALAEWIGEARPMMGTEVSVYLWSDDPEAGRVTVEAVFQEAARIDRLMSTYRDESEISKINREAANGPVAVSAELFELVRRSIEVSRLSDGTFDITYDSIGQHFDFRERRRPDAETTAAQLPKIDFRHLELDEENLTIAFRVEGVRINLGGIAKGYVVERGVQILRDKGVSSGVVTAGGDSRLLGNRGGRPFNIAIRDPRRDGEVAMLVPLEDEAISTSGDYERYFEEDGIRYHHIIAPSTGAPASGVHSASVIGPDAVMTDALSTTVFILGVDRGLTLIARLSAYEAIVIDASGRVFYSDGLAPPE